MLSEQIAKAAVTPPSKSSQPADKAGHSSQPDNSHIVTGKVALEALRDELNAEVIAISQAVACLLRNANGKPEKVDLSYARFWNADWSGINFRKTNLTNAYFDRVNLDAADLSEVTFEGGPIRQMPLVACYAHQSGPALCPGEGSPANLLAEDGLWCCRQAGGLQP
jgi:uncharacterized protein YjbI with pentapeptide repeats